MEDEEPRMDTNEHEWVVESHSVGTAVVVVEEEWWVPSSLFQLRRAGADLNRIANLRAR